MAWSFLKKVIEHLPSRHVEDRNLQIIKSVRSIVTDYLAMMNDEEGLYGIGQCTKFGSCCSEVAAQKREVIRQLQREIKEGRTDESAAAKPMADEDFEKLRTICGWNDATSITGCQMKDDTTRQWEWLADILTCVDAHLLNIERCHRILHDIQSCDVALVSDLRNTAFRTSPCNVPMNAEEIIIQIKKLATSLLRWLEKVESLLMRSRNTTIIRIGELPDSKATMVRCLCALRSNSVLVQKDEMLLLVDVTANNTLTLENNTKEHVSLPSLLCAALETDNVVKERAKKLQLSLLDGWTSCIIAVGRHIVSFLQISYQEWLQKKEIIKILTGSQSSTVVETVSSSEETFSVFAVTFEECKEFREIVRSVIKLLQNTENLDLNVTQLDTQVSCIRMTPNQLADLLEEYKTLRALWRSLQNTVGSSEIEDTLSPSHAPCIVEMGNDLPAVFDDVAETTGGDSEDLCVEVSCDELPSDPEVEAQYMHENVSPIAESFVYSSGNSKNFYSMESGIDMVSNAESVIDTESITDYAATYATADMESNFSIQESNMSDLSFHYEENQNESEHFRVSEDISRGIVDVLFSTPKEDKTNEVSGSEQECSIDFQQDTGRFAKHQEFHRNPSDTQIDVNIDSECFPSVETEHDELLLDNLDHSHNLNEVQSHPTNKHEGEGTLFLRETDCMMNSKQNSSVLDEEQGPVQSNLQNILCQENEVHDRDVQPEEIRLVNRNETEIHPSATLLTITNIMGHSDSCMMEYSSHDADEDHSIFPSNQCENTRFPSLNESQYDSLPNVEPCYSQSQIKEEFSITHDADSPSAILQDTLNCSFDSPKLQGVTKNSSLVHNVTVLSFRDEIISDPLSDTAKQLKAQEIDSIVHDELPIQQDHDEASIADNRLYQQSHSPQLQSISYTVTDQSLRLCERYYSRTHAVSETGIKSEKCCINDHSQISASTENIKSQGYDNLPSDASMTQEISGIETFPQALVDINSDTTEDIPENEIVPPSPSIAGNTDDSKTINAAEAFDRNTKCDSDISDTNLVDYVDFNTDIGDSLNESGYQTFYSESDISYSALESSFNHHSEHSDKNGLTPDHTSDEKAGGNYGNKLCMNKQNPTNTEQFRYSATSENVIRSCVDISETQDFVDCVSRAATISSIDNTKTMQTTRDNLANRNTSQSQNIDNISESLDNTTVSLSPNDRVTISEINMTESSTYSNSSQNDTFSADPQNVSTTCDSRETTQSQKSSDINDRCQLTSENIMKLVSIPTVVDNTISEDACGMMTSVGYITKGHQIVNNSDNVLKGSDEKRGEVIIENTEVEPEIVDTTVCYLTMNHELAEFTEMKQTDSDIIDQDISDNSPNVSLLGKKRKDIDILNDSEMLDPSDINLSQRISDNTDMIPSNIDVTTNQIITATSTTSSVHDKQTRTLTDDSIENTTTVCNRSKDLDISDTPIMENSISDMIAIPDITNTTDDMQRVSEMTKKYDAQSIIVASPPISDNTARTAAINESQTNNDVSDNIGSSQAVIEMYSDADKTDLLIQNVSNINASHNISDTSESVTTVVNSLISEAITDDTKIFPSPNNAFTTHGVSSTIESMSSLTSTLTSDSISDNIEMISSENDITECSDIHESTDKLSSSRLLTISSMNSEQRDNIETEFDITTGNDASDTTGAMLFDSDISTDPCITDKTEMKPMTIGLVNHKDASDSKPCITDVATSPCDLDNTDILTTSRSITTPQDMPSVITLTVRQSITSDVEVTPTVKDSYLTSGTESSFIHLFDSTHLTDHEEILEGNSADITINGAAVITESAPSVSEISPSHGKIDALSIMSKSVTNLDVSCAIGTISSLPKENAISGIFDNTIVNDNTSYENPDINNKTARSSIMDNQGVIPAEITNSDISDTTRPVSYVIETDTNHAMSYNSEIMTCSSDASEGHDSSDMTSTMSYVSDMPSNLSTTDTIEKFSIGNDIITNNDTYPTSGEIPSVIKVTTSPDVTENTAMLSAHQDIISIHDTNDIVPSVPVEIPRQINFAEEETNSTDNEIPIHNAPDTITAAQSASGSCLITTYDNENTENMAKTCNTICHDCTCTSRTILSVSDMPTSPDIDSTSEIILQTSDKNQNSDMFESQPCGISNNPGGMEIDPDLTINTVITHSLEVITTGPISSDNEMVRNPVTSEETEMIQNVISDISANIIDKSDMKPNMNDTVTDHDFSIDSEKLSSENDITMCDDVCYTTRIEQSVSDTHTNPNIIDNATMMSNAREITTICEFSDETESLSSVGDAYPRDAVSNTTDTMFSVRGVDASRATKDMKEDTPTTIYVPTHHDVPDIPAIVPTVSLNKDDEMSDTTDIMQIESEELAKYDGLVNENTKKRIGDNKFTTSNGISDIIDRKAPLTDITMFRDILENPDICPHFTDESTSQSNSYDMSPSLSDMTTSKYFLVNTENMHENEQSMGQTIFDITENQPCPDIPSTNEMVSISNGIPTTQEHTNYTETIIYNVGMTGNNEITATTSDISTSQVVSQNITEIILADVPEGASVPSVNTNNEIMHTVESCDVCDITEPSPCITDTVTCPEITDDIKLMTTNSEIISNCDVCDKGETIHFVSDITHRPGITNNLRPASATCDISTNHDIPDIKEKMSATDIDLIKRDKEIVPPYSCNMASHSNLSDTETIPVICDIISRYDVSGNTKTKSSVSSSPAIANDNEMITTLHDISSSYDISDNSEEMHSVDDTCIRPGITVCNVTSQILNNTITSQTSKGMTSPLSDVGGSSDISTKNENFYAISRNENNLDKTEMDSSYRSISTTCDVSYNQEILPPIFDLEPGPSSMATNKVSSIFRGNDKDDNLSGMTETTPSISELDANSDSGEETGILSTEIDIRTSQVNPDNDEILSSVSGITTNHEMYHNTVTKDCGLKTSDDFLASSGSMLHDIDLKSSVAISDKNRISPSVHGITTTHDTGIPKPIVDIAPTHFPSSNTETASPVIGKTFSTANNERDLNLSDISTNHDISNNNAETVQIFSEVTCSDGSDDNNKMMIPLTDTDSRHDVTYANNNDYIHRFSNMENNRDNAVLSARKTNYDVPVIEARPVIDYSRHGVANVGDVPTVRDCPTSQGLFGVDEKVSSVNETHSNPTNNENSGMVSYFNVHISDTSDLSSAETDIVTNFSKFSANTDVTPTVICITKNGNKTEPLPLEDNNIICAAERRMSPDTITHSVNNLEDTGYTTFSWETPVSKDSAENVYEIYQNPSECNYRNRRTFLNEPIMPSHESHADKYMSLQTSGDGIFNSHSVDDNPYLLKTNPNDNALTRPLYETYAKSKKDDDCLPENEATRLHLRTTVQETLSNSDRGYSSCSPTTTDALVPPTVLHETRSIREAISDLNLSVEQRRRRRGRLSKSSKSKVHTKPENSNGGYGIAVSKSKLSCTPNSTACREKESDCQSRTIGVFPGVKSTDKHLAITQVWDGNNATFVTVDYAIKKGILNLETASYMQNTNGDVFSIANAVALGLVQVNVQQSFEKDANLLPVYGLVTITSERKANTAHLTSLFDRDNRVFSPDQPLLHEIGESLAEISRSGRHQMTDPALIKKDKQHNIANTTSFYIIETVTNTETGQLMSFPEAIEANIIRPSIGSYFNSLSRRHISIMDAMASGHICYHKLSDNCSFMCSLNDKQTNIPEESTQCLSFSECVSVSQLNRHVERVKNNTIKTPSVSLDITNKIENVDRMIDSSIQQITTASTVAGVVDTVTKKIVFPLDALEMGLIKNARYVFRDTGKSITITQAVSQGLILFEHEQSALKRHTHDRLGLFTIETVRCSKVWTIRSAINLASGEELSPEEAADCGVLVMSTGKFRNFRSGTEHSLPEARELGYILCDSTSRDTTKTPVRREKYIVHSVCDRQRKTFVSYLDAQKRHLLCPITGFYRDNVRKTSMTLADAVIRGHVIATRSIEFPN